MRAQLPDNESQRLAALAEYDILDSLPETAYDDITHLASELCGAPLAAVSLVDENRQWFKAAVGLDVTETPRDIAFCAHALFGPEVLVIPDARTDARFADNPLVTDNPKFRFYAGAPLVTPGGEVLGTLCVIDHVSRDLSEEQSRSLTALARQVMAQLELRRLVVEQRQSRRQLEKVNAKLKTASLTDDVSGYYNTRFLHQFLDKALRPTDRQPLSLVFFDMDEFKAVVDEHGHLLGARVLREVAEVVAAHLEPTDRLVRYGGDEFVVILPDQGSDAALDKTVRLKEAIEQASFLVSESLDVRTSASFGLATYPEDASDKRELLMAADQCLFRSKAEGKNRVARPGGPAGHS